MKKLTYFIILLFFVSGCVTSKHKIKDKQESNSLLETKNSLNSDEKIDVESNQIRKDSISIKSKYNIEKNELFAAQNFQLKNNGKCGDPGTLRNVEFTDALGNKTSIPVNDNTELNFQNQSELKKEVESLKVENKQLIKTITETQSKYEKVLNQNQELKQKTNTKSSNANTKTESSSIWQFILCGVLSIIVWGLIKKLIKKYLP